MNESYTIRHKLNFWFYPFAVPILASLTIGFLMVLPSSARFYLLLFLIGVTFFAVLLTNMRNALLFLILLRSTVDLFQNVQIELPGMGQMNLAGVLSLMIIFGGILYIAGNKVKILSLPAAKPFLALILTALVSLFFSPNLAVSFQEWLRLLSFFIIYVLAAQCLKDKKHINQLIAVLFISILFPSIVAFYQLFTGTGNLGTTGFNRIMGTFVHPNLFAYYLLLILTLAVILVFESKKSWVKLGMLLLCIPLSILLLNTFTRGVWIAFFLILFLLGAARYRKLLIILPLIIIILALSVPSFSERFVDLVNPTNPYGPQNSLISRIDIWAETYPLFLSGPIMGSGLGSSTFLVTPTHNDFLKLLAEIGILGVAFYLWLLLRLARHSWFTYVGASNPYYKGLVLGFFALLVIPNILTIDNLMRTIPFQWSFWALAAVVAKISDKSVFGSEKILVS